ncbi:MAG: cupredoxin domain-containing protein, partial [bacterium]
MRRLAAVIAVGLLLTAPAPAGLAQAQDARKVVQVTAVSYRFTPNVITVNRGDTVVLQFSNEDTAGRAHSFGAAWMVDLPVTSRGTFQTGMSNGRRFFVADVGQKFELEFVAAETGSFPFVCTVFGH